MSAGDLKQQLAVAHAESAEFNQKAIQASTQAEGLQTQVGHLTQTNNFCCRHCFPEALLHQTHCTVVANAAIQVQTCRVYMPRGKLGEQIC